MMAAEVPNTTQPPPSKGSWEWFFRIPGLVLGQLGYISVYGYPGVFVGTFLSLVGACVGRPYSELPLWMFFGITLHLAFLSYWLQPERILERKFKLWDQMGGSRNHHARPAQRMEKRATGVVRRGNAPIPPACWTIAAAHTRGHRRGPTSRRNLEANHRDSIRFPVG